MIGAEELVNTAVIALYRRWMRTEGFVHYCSSEKSGNDGASRITCDHVCRDNLFGDYDHPLGCTHSLQHDAEISPAMRIAFSICPLHIDDSYIRNDGAHRQQHLLRFKRGNDLVKEVVPFWDIAAHRGPGGKERHAHGSGLKTESDGEVR